MFPTLHCINPDTYCRAGWLYPVNTAERALAVAVSSQVEPAFSSRAADRRTRRPSRLRLASSVSDTREKGRYIAVSKIICRVKLCYKEVWIKVNIYCNPSELTLTLVKYKFPTNNQFPKQPTSSRPLYILNQWHKTVNDRYGLLIVSWTLMFPLEYFYFLFLSQNTL